MSLEEHDRPALVLLGDSITYAWPVPADEAGRRLHRGVPGETSVDMLRRFEADVLALAPCTLHIMAGTNDVAENGGGYDERVTLAAIADMAGRAGAAGTAVLIASVPPAGAIPWNPLVDPVPRIRALNRSLAMLARRARIGFVDYGGVLADRDGAMRAGLADDGLHPNAAGYELMEARLQQALAGRDARRGWFRRRPST